MPITRAQLCYDVLLVTLSCFFVNRKLLVAEQTNYWARHKNVKLSHISTGVLECWLVVGSKVCSNTANDLYLFLVGELNLFLGRIKQLLL